MIFNLQHSFQLVCRLLRYRLASFSFRIRSEFLSVVFSRFRIFDDGTCSHIMARSLLKKEKKNVYSAFYQRNLLRSRSLRKRTTICRHLLNNETLSKNAYLRRGVILYLRLQIRVLRVLLFNLYTRTYSVQALAFCQNSSFIRPSPTIRNLWLIIVASSVVMHSYVRITIRDGTITRRTYLLSVIESKEILRVFVGN